MEVYQQQVEESAAFLRTRLAVRPQVGIILGTGHGALTQNLSQPLILSYEEIPHFPRATGPSHRGQLINGSLGGKALLVFQGRFHAYEGYSLRQVTFPVRIMAALGMKLIIITNAAGGLNPLFRTGELMLITDHINLMGDNPLVGDNVAAWGPRFPDLSAVYDRQLRDLTEQVALEQGLMLRQGVYVAVKGPSLETPAETRFLRLIGADAVGMSSVPEAIVAVHAGMRILGLSVIANVNLPDAMAPISLDEIIQAVQQTEPQAVRLLVGFLERLSAEF
ncbi:MAG: purine-nucleoside phosphorylase [Deltaproteobacteria bacterium]|nr:purine-nucleoside phosphorylase [Deltaproteobacteria bacterium]MBW1951664.1 purine-nucleoside phosphorylase [Deltaproteobacteria bacterium]MBW1985764.1 purine-nucleoside phosphorylase [Deltaproteobacteria bacterium]MBW2134678.1 purine-nucleoside phosphorylase [Deltaproteobacteria bacterium]